MATEFKVGDRVAFYSFQKGRVVGTIRYMSNSDCFADLDVGDEILSCHIKQIRRLKPKPKPKPKPKLKLKPREFWIIQARNAFAQYNVIRDEEPKDSKMHGYTHVREVLPKKVKP